MFTAYLHKIHSIILNLLRVGIRYEVIKLSFKSTIGISMSVGYSQLKINSKQYNGQLTSFIHEIVTTENISVIA